MGQEKIKFTSLGKVWFWLAISFAVIFVFIYPVDFHNLGGTHSWLSGVTLKFVNNWLEDGIWEDHLTCYESFDSIEFRSQEDRIPYLSYPTGSTFAVYIAAKLMGKDHVGIYFLKHFQLLWYFAEMLLLGTFLYILLTDIKIFSEREKNAVVYFMALFWVLQPINVWYLANIYFTDQAVILYVMAFLLFEYMSSRKNTLRGIVHIIKGIIIYFGILTDYYFWLLLFIVCIIRFTGNMILKRGAKNIIKEILWYACPSILALGTFVWQISHTDNWLNILISRFVTRTVGDVGDHALLKYFDNFYQTLADDSPARGVLLIGLEVIILILSVSYFKKNGGFRCIIIHKEYAILAAGVIAPILQILILRNHSIMHEFSMIKAGWILDMSILVLAFFMQKMTQQSVFVICGKKVNGYVWNFVVAYILFLCVSGVPFSAKDFLDSRNSKETYPLEQILYEHAQYEEVYFSFTYEINTYPPQRLAIAEKQVYKIASVEEIDTMFPKLPENAERRLIIEKNTGEKDAYVSTIEMLLAQNNEIVYEDENYCILHL